MYLYIQKVSVYHYPIAINPIIIYGCPVGITSINLAFWAKGLLFSLSSLGQDMNTINSGQEFRPYDFE